MENAISALALGLDVGTTKVAVSLVEAGTRNVIATHALAHASDVHGLPEGYSEQMVPRILEAMDECVRQLPATELGRVGAIGITGQMHGVLLWSPIDVRTSNLVTWQDQRCRKDNFDDELQKLTGDSNVQTGFGNATLAWWAKYENSLLESFQLSATIHDYLGALITNNNCSICDPTGAASWGFFDIRTLCWNLPAIERAGIPTSMLPTIKDCGAVIGKLSSAFSRKWGIPEGVPVINAIGDNQASLYGSITNPNTQVALTIGTGAQISVVIPELPNEPITATNTFECRPYVDKTYIAVGASLSGGRALATLADALQSFMLHMGITPTPSLGSIQTTMHQVGLRSRETGITASTSFGGERFDPLKQGAFTGISFSNLTVGDLTAACCRGIATSLRDMLPKSFLVGRKEIMGSGNAIQLSELMQWTIADVFGLPLTLTRGSETTATGAALLAATKCLRKTST